MAVFATASTVLVAIVIHGPTRSYMTEGFSSFYAGMVIGVCLGISTGGMLMTVFVDGPLIDRLFKTLEMYRAHLGLRPHNLRGCDGRSRIDTLKGKGRETRTS